MALLKGSLVRAHGLQKRPELNGTCGLIVAGGGGERITVLTIPQRRLLALRPKNLAPHADAAITVCAGCAQDFWSWPTHGGYAGWHKLSRTKFLCPCCAPAERAWSSASARAGGGESSWAAADSTRSGVWSSSCAGTDHGDAWSSCSAGTGHSDAWCTASVGMTHSGAWVAANAHTSQSCTWATASASYDRTWTYPAATPIQPGLVTGTRAPQPCEEPRTRVVREILDVSSALDTAYAQPASRPLWMTNPTDDNLREAGRYDPANGMGLAEEKDWGNFSGSVLMLAMLDAETYLPGGSSPLVIFGAGLLEKATAPPRSGRGPDNRRTNALEAILNHLQHFPHMAGVREKLQSTWRLVRLCLACCDDARSPLPHECVLQVLYRNEETIPRGMVTDEEVMEFEKVLHVLGQAARARLCELPSGNVSRSALSLCIGCSKDSATVKVLQEALHRCALEGAGEHGGNLHFIFFASVRRAFEPPAELAATAAKMKETDMLHWLRRRKLKLPTREERFNAWKKMLMQSHPDKLGIDTTREDNERLGLAIRCEFLREAKAWFVN